MGLPPDLLYQISIRFSVSLSIHPIFLAKDSSFGFPGSPSALRESDPSPINLAAIKASFSSVLMALSSPPTLSMAEKSRVNSVVSELICDWAVARISAFSRSALFRSRCAWMDLTWACT